MRHGGKAYRFQITRVADYPEFLGQFPRKRRTDRLAGIAFAAGELP